MNKASKIYIAGHRGLVGGAILRLLGSRGFSNIILRDHAELDLTDQNAVDRFFDSQRPDYVFLCAAKVGGIRANSSQPVEFLYQNTMIGYNVLHAAYRSGARKILNLGSSCIYPKEAPQPLKEEYLLSAPAGSNQ